MTPILLCVIAPDVAALGRVEYNMMNDQALLELLVTSCEGPNPFKDDKGNYTDISEWRGVRLNEKRVVERICWSLIEAPFFPGGGTMDFAWIPRTVTGFIIKGNSFRGTIDTAHLPPVLDSLNMSHNKLRGTFAVESLPRTTRDVHILHNELDGTLNLSALPSEMSVFNAGENLFTGTLDLTRLPVSIYSLWLHDNGFEGTIDLLNLPQGLRSLALENNNLRQKTVRIAAASIRACSIDLQGNRIEEIKNAEGMEISWTGSIRLRPVRSGI